MPDTQISTGVINYNIKENTFGDESPVIPSDSRVQFGAVLFRLDIDVTLAMNGRPASGLTPLFQVTGIHSHAQLLGPTDENGKAVLRLETRYVGKSTIAPLTAEYRDSSFDVNISEAWYEAPFLITAYNCCDEADFIGEMVSGSGVGMHKRDFLFGGTGVIMQGTGKTLDGKYVTISNPQKMKWNPGYAGVSNPQDALFTYSNSVKGAFNDVTAGTSIAIDPTVLPPRHRVEIHGSREIGQRRGDDTGGAIRNFHFDHYVGAGKAAMKNWEAAGGNLQGARIKYLGA